MMEWWNDENRHPVFCNTILQYYITPFRQFTYSATQFNAV
jgi:hypothetical protein